MKERGIKPVIPPKSNRTATIRYSKRFYRKHNCIERVLGHLKINRAIVCATVNPTYADWRHELCWRIVVCGFGGGSVLCCGPPLKRCRVPPPLQ